jgi:hypothetical protein
MDHPDSVPKPGRFPLILNPLVGMTRLTKALMDGGSVLNLMYLNTIEGLGLTRDQLQSSPYPFYGMVPCKQSSPLGGSLYWSPSETRATTAPRRSRLRWSTSLGLTMSSWGDHDMLSLWISPAMPTSTSRYPDPPGLSPWRPRRSGCCTMTRAALTWLLLWSPWSSN